MKRSATSLCWILGNEYTATCGQLKEITAVPGEYLEAGQILGYVAEPTKYYSVEGVNVFFELKHQEKAWIHWIRWSKDRCRQIRSTI